ncbi:MAG: hypothetical protein WCA85_12835 [Paraburkholderia sp.]|uniref:hypothetical protein n=1 Tax=Paraburkholderia sp. TaxID=1926495 RepID=UPI003C543499
MLTDVKFGLELGGECLVAIVLTALLCELIACFPGWLISSIRRIGSVGLVATIRASSDATGRALNVILSTLLGIVLIAAVFAAVALFPALAVVGVWVLLLCSIRSFGRHVDGIIERRHDEVTGLLRQQNDLLPQRSAGVTAKKTD